MIESTTLSDASTLRQRAAHIRFLASQISDERYIGLFRAAANDYEKAALDLEAEARAAGAPAYASAAE